jgi:UvrD-like helicase C-terminal domain
MRSPAAKRGCERALQCPVETNKVACGNRPIPEAPRRGRLRIPCSVRAGRAARAAAPTPCAGAHWCLGDGSGRCVIDLLVVIVLDLYDLVAGGIHKSQGSEYPAVIIPVLTQHYPMLQRNLLYTGVTRGKRIVGEKLINFADAASRHRDFAQELPRFISEVRRMFAPEEIGAQASIAERARQFMTIKELLTATTLGTS